MNEPVPLSPQLPLGVRWREPSTFESFVPGANGLVVESLKARAQGAGGALWLWGEAGSGRTHLLQACCARAGELGRRAAYFPFAALAEPAALTGCDELDLVCVDDADLHAGQPAWERALFTLYNGLAELGGALLLAGSRPPAACEWSLPDLSSRLAAGLVLRLQPLDEPERLQVLRLRARNRGLELPDDTGAFLLRRFPRDLSSLCALLDTLDAAALAAQRRLTIPFIKDAIAADPRFR